MGTFKFYTRLLKLQSINMRNIALSCIPALLLTNLTMSQNPNSLSVNPSLLTHEWAAKWIAVPGEPADDYGIYLFRKLLDLETVPENFVVHVSADNRYKLYVNNSPVSTGPARGDLFYWNYETVDLAPYLTAGRNILAAKVWNEGAFKPEAQISWRTGFIMQGDTSAEETVNTGNTWKCIRDDSYRPLEASGIFGYYVAGPGEFIDMKKHIKGWRKADFDDTAWKRATPAHWRSGSPKGLRDASGWMLVPSTIPQMERTVQRLKRTREASGIDVPASFPASTTIVDIPENTKATLLLDNGSLTNAYITLQFSRGRDSTVSLKYAEALYIPANSTGNDGSGDSGPTRLAGKGNRNEVNGKIFLGREDRLISDGTPHQVFTSLYWRTYRYILLTVETKEDPLFIEDIYGTFTGYPFELNSDFHSDQESLKKILEIGWRTARLCAMETYMDCPYYEQLQYIGDTRIQAMVSLYNSGDDRLVRNALNQIDHSRIAEGLTLSRYPTSSPQIIPTFSLWYIGMLHDYWMYGSDSRFVKEKISGTRQILEFFQKRQQSDGLLKNVPYWDFTDWVVNRPGWQTGVPPIGRSGNSSVLDLQLLLAYRTAAELERNLGMEAYAQLYNEQADSLEQAIHDKYWDEANGMFADTTEKNTFSQHANSLAILAGLASGHEAVQIAEKIMADSSLAPASIYFKYYLHRALIKAGFGNDYLKWLGKWHENIAMGMTTWAEDYDVNAARSDCHAWGSSPNIELYRTVLGIDSGAAGFSEARIEPHLGPLKKAGGEIPHSQGTISVDYELKEGKWIIEIRLPGTLTGSFIWEGKTYSLKAGLNKMALYGRHKKETERWTEEYQAAVYRHNIAMIENMPFVQGTTPWILKDFRSPRRPLPGIQDYWNRKGLLSEKGERKLAWKVLNAFYKKIKSGEGN
jgi:alpha-L-rhamnosidase